MDAETGTRTVTVEEMLTVGQLSQLLSVSPRTLDNWRSASRGPAYYRFERTVRYRLSDVMAWLESSRVETLETPGLSL